MFLFPINIFSRGQSSDSEHLKVGLYRFTFSPKIISLSDFPDLERKEFSVLGKKAVIEGSEKDFQKNRYIVLVRLLENPIPIIVVVGALAGTIGLGLIYLSLEKVERIVEAPATFLVALGAVVSVVGYYFLRKKK
jgi:CTP-dependent riboflavin kinase